MLSLLFFTLVKPADDPAVRFETFMRSAKTLSANLDMTVSSNPAPGKGTFQVLRPNHLLFRMKWGPSDYSFSIAGNEIVAIERGNKIYREYGNIGEMFIPDNDISQTPDFGFPAGLMAGTLRAMLPRGVAFKVGEKSEFEGQSVDNLSATWPTQTGTVTARARIDPMGRLVEFQREFKGGFNVTVKVRVTGYKINEPMKPAAFLTPVPAGFVPETLPTDSYPLNVGEKMPWGSWKRLAGTGALSTLASKKVLFLAISDVGCEVSQRAARTVDLLKSKIEAKGGVSAGISLSPDPAQKPVFRNLPAFFDPGGKASETLRAPGSPMFLLVAPNGTVTRVWYGFDVSKSGEFVSDVVEWIEKSKHPENLSPGDQMPPIKQGGGTGGGPTRAKGIGG